MGKANFTEDFKREAVLQITERGYPVAEVAARLGIGKYSLYEWKKRYSKPAAAAREDDQAAEDRPAEARVAAGHRGARHPKKSGRVLRQGCKVKYAFIAEHRLLFSIRAMCRCLRVQPSGFYAWLKHPLSKRAREDQRQTELIRAAWSESGKVYGYRKLHDDLAEPVSEPGRKLLPEPGCAACRHPGADRLQAPPRPPLRQAIPGARHTLDRRFDAEAPDKAWVTDITYIRTHEGFAYLAVVIDLFSRRVVGWSMQARQTTNVVLQALLAAVWRRKPKGRVLVHSDQGSQFTSMEWGLRS